jgi:Na+/proline symporter
MQTVDIVIYGPWVVLLAYASLTLVWAPRNTGPAGFFNGSGVAGSAPGLALLAASAAVTWVFAKSVSNAASLGAAFGVWGGIGYAGYYLSFIVVAVTAYLIRTRTGAGSLAQFLAGKYGVLCAKLFLAAIAIRLFNEVWSNTKVGALYFGDEGSGAYWLAVLAITGFTLAYSWRGGLRSSLLTDMPQMLLALALLAVVLALIGPELATTGLPRVPDAARSAGITFTGLALVQALSYGFHDPVMTDRAFIASPRTTLKAFVLAGLLSGGFIVAFSGVGLYANVLGLEGDAAVVVPMHLGLPALLLFNAIMLTSAGSTLDSAFASSAKLGARDWRQDTAEPEARHLTLGRRFMLAIAVLGNLPLLSIYMGDQIGPAIIAATTISGTMVMGLAPIFFLAWIRAAGAVAFHTAFWTGIVLGVVMTLEGIAGVSIVPGWMDLGVGKYADDLGVNAWGLILCTVGYLAGAVVDATIRRAPPVAAPAAD